MIIYLERHVAQSAGQSR